MTEVCLTLTFNHLTISWQLLILLIPPMHKQFRQMELLMAIPINKHLQRSQYSRFCYINVTQGQVFNNVFLKWVNGTIVQSDMGVIEGSQIIFQHDYKILSLLVTTFGNGQVSGKTCLFSLV